LVGSGVKLGVGKNQCIAADLCLDRGHGHSPI
jgi:hypothetical protein